MASSPITSWQIDGETMESVTDFNFFSSKITLGADYSQEIKRLSFLGRKTMTNLDSVLKSRDVTLPTWVHLIKLIVSPVVMYRCDSWTIKKALIQKSRCFWIVVLEKTLESPLDSKEIKPVNPKRNQSWILIGRTDAEAETPIPWPPDAKSQLIEKDLDAGKDWRQEEKGAAEDEIVGWHHWLNVHKFEQSPGDSEGQGSLACYSPWGHKELNTTEWLNNNNNTLMEWKGKNYMIISIDTEKIFDKIQHLYN